MATLGAALARLAPHHTRPRQVTGERIRVEVDSQGDDWPTNTAAPDPDSILQSVEKLKVVDVIGDLYDNSFRAVSAMLQDGEREISLTAKGLGRGSSPQLTFSDTGVRPAVACCGPARACRVQAWAASGLPLGALSSGRNCSQAIVHCARPGFDPFGVLAEQASSRAGEAGQ